MTTAHDTIAERMTALQDRMASRLPAGAGSAFAAEQNDLRAAGIPPHVAAVGTPMPDAELLDAAGQPTSVRATTAGRPAVIVFYRGAWCPYCNVALRTYQEQLVPELDRRGIALLAISPQKPDGSLSMQQAHDLTYAVLSDPGSRIAGALGIRTAPTPEVRATQATLGLNLTEVNADGTTDLPMPTTVLVDGNGTIRWIDVHPDYTTRTEPADVLAAADTHLG